MDSRSSHLCLFLLLLLASPLYNISSCADARPLPFLGQEKYVKVLASLGMMCQCSDGAAGGESRSSWQSTCAKLECRPWKFF